MLLRKLVRENWYTPTVRLEAETHNEHDAHAIAVFIDAVQVGHLPRSNFQPTVYEMLKRGRVKDIKIVELIETEEGGFMIGLSFVSPLFIPEGGLSRPR